MHYKLIITDPLALAYGQIDNLTDGYNIMIAKCYDAKHINES